MSAQQDWIDRMLGAKPLQAGEEVAQFIDGALAGHAASMRETVEGWPTEVQVIGPYMHALAARLMISEVKSELATRVVNPGSRALLAVAFDVLNDRANRVPEIVRETWSDVT